MKAEPRLATTLTYLKGCLQKCTQSRAGANPFDRNLPDLTPAQRTNLDGAIDSIRTAIELLSANQRIDDEKITIRMSERAPPCPPRPAAQRR